MKYIATSEHLEASMLCEEGLDSGAKIEVDHRKVSSQDRRSLAYGVSFPSAMMLAKDYTEDG